MSVETEHYVVYGTKIPSQKLESNDIPYSKRSLHSEVGDISVIYDGRNEEFCVVGKILDRVRGDEIFDGVYNTGEIYLSEDERNELDNLVKNIIGRRPRRDWISAHIFSLVRWNIKIYRRGESTSDPRADSVVVEHKATDLTQLNH